MDSVDVRWDFYPLVAAHTAARSFVERLALKGKRPKTVDAYARGIEDLLTYFQATDPDRVLEADEGDLDGYFASLKQRGPKKRGRGGLVEEETKIRHLSGHKLSDNTIAQRVVACRLFYDFLLRKRWRSDPINPIHRGNDGRDGQRPVRGPVSRKTRLSNHELEQLASLATVEALDTLRQALAAHEKRLAQMQQQKAGRNALVGAQRKRITFIQKLIAVDSVSTLFPSL